MKLFAYQQAGAEWLAARKVALLWDEQGVGKSAQVVRAADQIAARVILVICPAGVREHWRREWIRWQQLDRKIADDGSVLIISYERATADADALARVAWDVVVIDEHHYLKTPKAKRTKAILTKGGALTRAKRVWALSGTPMPNTPDELWTILRTLAPDTIKLDGRPMSRFDFISRYCRVEHNDFGMKIIGAKNLGELALLLKPHTLRRRKAEVLADLPPMVWATLPLTMTADQQHVLDALHFPDHLWDEAAASEGGDLIDQLLDAFTREQISTLMRLTGELKAAILAPLLVDELQGAEHKLVVGYWHRSAGNILTHALARFGYVRVDGSCTPKQRADGVDHFQNDKRVRVFLGQLKAAGTGISLTAADQVVLVEQSWVPSDNAQFAARPHRHGQRGSVLVRSAYLAGSIDEAVTLALVRKSIDIAQVVDPVANDNAPQPEAGAA